MLAEPARTPDTTPAVTLAIAVFDDVHVPEEGEAESVIEVPSQTPKGPLITGSEFTVICLVTEHAAV